MSGPSTPAPAPTPPGADPAAVIAASQAAAKQTAESQARLNATNQTGPFGSITPTFNPDGTISYNTNLSPAEAAVYGANTVNRLGAGAAAGSAVGNVSRDISSGPIDTTQTGNYLTNLARQRLDPILQTQRQQKETQLYNQGARPGTPAWDLAQTELGRQENDAYNQLLLQGEGQAYSEAAGNRAYDINTLGSLFGASQPNFPTPIQTPQTQVQPTNVPQVYNNANEVAQQQYQNNVLVPWQASNQYNQALMGGAFGLAGAGAGAFGTIAGRGGFGNPFGVQTQSNPYAGRY